MKYLIIILLILSSCKTVNPPAKEVVVRDTIFLQGEGRISYTDTVQITTHPFISYYDTTIIRQYETTKNIYKYDTFNISYKFPDNLFSFQQKSSPDTLIKIQKIEKGWWEIPVIDKVIIGIILVGFVILITRIF